MKSWCKHYNLDVLLGDKTRVCSADINVRDLVGGKDFGWARRIPCNQKNESSVVCEKLLMPTPEEQAEDEAEWKET
ncbi:MAG: hypothetical protein KAS32_06585, partial [Candidatus Peribacteraceae bacterium]|nr:hypothetical protein [Candidatus Peribacteraceae bacterium]